VRHSGFESNPEWRTRYLGPGWDLAKVRGTRFNTGDGIRMALEIGASPKGNWSGCHAVGWDRNAPEFGDLAVGDGFQKHSYPWGIMLNANGERFVDEGADFRNWKDAEGDRLLDAGRAENDPAKRKAIYLDLQKRIADGVAGNVELVSILSRDPAPPPVSYIERSGGLYRDMMIHDFDMARFLLGEDPVEVYAVGSSLVDPAIGKAGDVDTAAVVMKSASGKICQISCSRRATYGYDQRVEVHGSKGLLTAGNIHETTVGFAGKHGFTTDPALNFFLERYANAYRNEVEAFIDAVIEGRAPSPSGLDGLKAQQLADAAQASLDTGKPVKVG